MYTVTKNTKIISLVLMLTGVVALGYGFIQGAGHHTDEEVTHQVEAFAHDLQLHLVDHNDANQKTVESTHKYIHDQHSDEEAHFAPLFHKIEEEFHLHFTKKEMIEAHDIKHVIHSTIHALHSKGQRPWSSLLVSAIFFLAVSLLSVFFFALQYVAEVGWSVILLRVVLAMGSFLPYVALIIILIILTGGFHLFGNHTYHWMADGIMNPESSNYDAIIAGKKGYLNFSFFIIRAVVYFVGWIWAYNKLSNLSFQEDTHGGLLYHNSMKKISAIFIVFFAVTSSMMAWDWIMSIDTHWFSTLFGWYVFSSMFVTFLVVLFMIVLNVKSQGQLEYFNDSHHHDLGKFIFAFSIFWTYLWFAQFMLIWYSNIPEEVTYFITRIEDYNLLFFGMVVLNLIFPLIVLMNSDFKKTNFIVILTGIVIIIGHYLDVYNMIMPSAVGNMWSFGAAEIGGFLFFLGIFIYVVFREISKAPILAKGDPFIEESKTFQYYNLD